MYFNNPYLSVARLALCSLAINFILKGGFFVISLFMLLSRFDVVANIGCNAI